MPSFQPRPVVQLPPVVVRNNIYPDIPATDLVCKAAPAPAIGIRDDVAFALYNQSVLDAWYDCFTKMLTIKGIVDKWPVGSTTAK